MSHFKISNGTIFYKHVDVAKFKRDVLPSLRDEVEIFLRDLPDIEAMGTEIQSLKDELEDTKAEIKELEIELGKA